MAAKSIHQGVSEFRNTPGALLLDVRTPQEYRQGHSPGSKNLPLQQLDNAPFLTDNMDTALFVYCHSGIRSSQAAIRLQEMGYTQVQSIGGIASYFGKLNR